MSIGLGEIPFEGFCKWIIDDGLECCGQVAIAKRSYCSEHQLRASPHGNKPGPAQPRQVIKHVPFIYPIKPEDLGL
jgi:hypothetical protein